MTKASVTACPAILEIGKYYILSQDIYFPTFNPICIFYKFQRHFEQCIGKSHFLFPDTYLGSSQIYLHTKERHTYTHTLIISIPLSDLVCRLSTAMPLYHHSTEMNYIDGGYFCGYLHHLQATCITLQKKPWSCHHSCINRDFNRMWPYHFKGVNSCAQISCDLFVLVKYKFAK